MCRHSCKHSLVLFILLTLKYVLHKSSNCLHFVFNSKLQADGGHGFHLIGHSTGGKLASAVALKFPHLVSSLTLVDVIPGINLRGDIFQLKD